MRFGLRELIFVIVLLAVPVASWWYVFKPRNAEIDQAKAEVLLKKTKLNKLREVSRQIDDISLAIELGQEAVRCLRGCTIGLRARGCGNEGNRKLAET